MVTPFLMPLFTSRARTKWNSADKSAIVTLSGSDLTASMLGVTGAARTNLGRTSGKRYFELRITTTSGSNLRLGGIASASYSLATGSLGRFDALSAGINSTDGQALLYANSGSSISGFNLVWAAGDPEYAGFAVDIPNKLLYAHVKGGYATFQNPSTATGGVNFVFSGPVFPIAGHGIADGSGGGPTTTTIVGNFKGPFAFPIPTGYTAWG